ncbi:hypothetical protein PDJAM_G00249430, partial [Pangasius djambal]|nr:hypothetical protein [Pangasius djambal]
IHTEGVCGLESHWNRGSEIWPHTPAQVLAVMRPDVDSPTAKDSQEEKKKKDCGSV